MTTPKNRNVPTSDDLFFQLNESLIDIHMMFISADEARKRMRIAWGLQVRRLRLERNVNMKELAEFAGIKESNLSSMETGYRNYWSQDAHNKIVEFFLTNPPPAAI